MHTLRYTFTALTAVLLLTACSRAPETAAAKDTVHELKKAPQSAPEPVAALTAFYEMYKPARTWAPDLLPLSLAATEIPSVKNDSGKSGMWTVIFVSPRRAQARTYSYAVMDSPLAPKGVTARAIQAWTGGTRQSRPFQITELIVNSDVAWTTAARKADPWLKKHPDKKASILLESNGRFGVPVWFIMWGDTKNGYAAFVNATTGALMAGK